MVSPSDRRRQYVTGFTGSAGTAVVTLNSAALWVDGRYHLQADQQLDCQWIVMKSGQDQVPSISEYLKSILSSGDRVGADPKLVSADQWLEWRSELGKLSINKSKNIFIIIIIKHLKCLHLKSRKWNQIGCRSSQFSRLDLERGQRKTQTQSSSSFHSRNYLRRFNALLMKKKKKFHCCCCCCLQVRRGRRRWACCETN